MLSFYGLVWVCLKVQDNLEAFCELHESETSKIFGRKSVKLIDANLVFMLLAIKYSLLIFCVVRFCSTLILIL